MATPQTLDKLHVRELTVESITFPPNSVTDNKVAPGADIDPTKMRHRNWATRGQKNGTANVAQREGLTTIHGTSGTLVAVHARNITGATTGSSTSVQIKKNGINILVAAITLDDVAADDTQSSSSFTSSSLVADDQLDVDITVAGGAPGQGVSATLVWDEKAS